MDQSAFIDVLPDQVDWSYTVPGEEAFTPWYINAQINCNGVGIPYLAFGITNETVTFPFCSFAIEVIASPSVELIATLGQQPSGIVFSPSNYQSVRSPMPAVTLLPGWSIIPMNTADVFGAPWNWVGVRIAGNNEATGVVIG